MDVEEFRRRAKEAVDYVADYYKNRRDINVTPTVKPGFLEKLLPAEAPELGEKWEDVFNDLDKIFMKGVLHSYGPHFNAYFPLHNSHESCIADFVTHSFQFMSSLWIMCPSATELEVITMNWLAKMLKLPQEFMSGGKGGGVLLGSASESILMAVLSARKHAVLCYQRNKTSAETDIIGRMVCYTSEEAHYTVSRMCAIAAVKCHKLETDKKHSLRGSTLTKRIDIDKKNGFIPILCVATLGTTGLCAFDNLLEIGKVCEKEDMWLHIDAAYAGAAFICPEFRPLLNGVEYAQSFNFNCHKWMLVTYPCSAMWFRNTVFLPETETICGADQENPNTLPEYRSWQLPVTRLASAIKLWFVLRSFGIKGLQKHIHNHVSLAHEFETCVKADPRFEITQEVKMGLVAFRLKDSNDINDRLLKAINDDCRIHLLAGTSKGVYFLRYVVSTLEANSDDIKFAWNAIKEITNNILKLSPVS